MIARQFHLKSPTLIRVLNRAMATIVEPDKSLWRFIPRHKWKAFHLSTYHEKRAMRNDKRRFTRPYHGIKADPQWPNRVFLIIWKRNTIEQVIEFIHPRGYTFNINLKPWTQ